MTALDTDTIAAIATPRGRGGIGVIRVSGPHALAIHSQLCRRERPPNPRRPLLETFHDAAGEPIDRGLVLFFPGPASFTGEDVIELHGHGGPVLMDMLLAAALEAGARLARPGEFSERAYLNGKLDLAQAEAVGDLIDGATQAAVRGAMRSLSGEFSSRIEGLAEGLRELRAFVEAAIDFPEEEVDFLAEGSVQARVQALAEELGEIEEAARRGALLSAGVKVVLVGAPNVGKSSLMNRLAGEDRAIVTAVPGTTRDVLRADFDLDGIPVHLVDTAGLRSSEDPVEQEGVRRALAELADADLALVVTDATRAAPDREPVPPGIVAIDVRNKIDLCAGETASPTGDPQEKGALRVSALTGGGLGALRDRLRVELGLEVAGEGTFTARRRHLDVLRRVGRQLTQAREAFAQDQAGELLAEDLRRAHDLLGEITGRVTPDALLGDIFSRFCIGK